MSGEGMAFVYQGSSAGLGPSPDWTGEGDQVGAQFGISVSTAGDVNGDGYADVIVGASWADGGHPSEGRAYLFRGSPTGLQPVASWMTESNITGAYYGNAVSTAGDVNGDGYADVIRAGPGERAGRRLRG